MRKSALIALVFSFLLCGMADYYIQLTQDALSNREFSKAIEYAKQGLLIDSENKKLIELMKTAEAKHSRKVATEKIEKEKAAKAARKKHAVIARKKKIDELNKTWCDCKVLKIQYKSLIKEQHEIGRTAGVVDKAALHKAGKAIYNIELTEKVLQSEFTNSGTLPEPCSEIIKSDGQCTLYMYNNLQKLNNYK